MKFTFNVKVMVMQSEVIYVTTNQIGYIQYYK